MIPKETQAKLDEYWTLQNPIMRDELESIAKETGTPYGTGALKALAEVDRVEN